MQQVVSGMSESDSNGYGRLTLLIFKATISSRHEIYQLHLAFWHIEYFRVFTRNKLTFLDDWYLGNA